MSSMPRGIRGGPDVAPPLVTRLVVKGLVVAVVLGALVSIGYTKMEAEPWPALMMPRFGGVPERLPYNYLTLEIAARTQTGELVAVDRNELLADIPVSLHKGIINRFSPNKEQVSAETGAWLEERLAVMYPGMKFAALEFSWSRISKLGEGGSISPTEQLDTYVVNLR